MVRIPLGAAHLLVDELQGCLGVSAGVVGALAAAMRAPKRRRKGVSVMADPPVSEGQARQAPPNPNGPEAHEPVDWQARAAEAEKKLGAVLNENKRIKAARDELSSNVKRWSGLEEAGHTPEQITEILSKQEQQTLDQARDRGEIDKLLENKDKTYQKQLKAKDDDHRRRARSQQRGLARRRADAGAGEGVRPGPARGRVRHACARRSSWSRTRSRKYGARRWRTSAATTCRSPIS